MAGKAESKKTCVGEYDVTLLLYFKNKEIYIMNKTEMIKNVSDRVDGVSQKDVDAILSAYVGVVKDALVKGKDEKVTLPGIGAFSVKHVPERTGIVQLGESKGSTWTKPAHDELVFKIAKSVKELA